MNRLRRRTNFKAQEGGDYASLGSEWVYHIMPIKSDDGWGAWFEFKVELGAAL